MAYQSTAFFLTVRKGPGVGIVHPVGGNVITIGRQAGNTIVLDDHRVSRRHAQLIWRGSGYMLEDLGSGNGTWVNNVRITAPVLLRPGDTVGLSQDVVLLFSDRPDTDDATYYVPAGAAVPTVYPPSVPARPATGPVPAPARGRSPGWMAFGVGGLIALVGALLLVIVGLAWYFTSRSPAPGVTPGAETRAVAAATVSPTKSPLAATTASAVPATSLATPTTHPTEAPRPTATSVPALQPTEAPAPSATPVLTARPHPTDTPYPTVTSEPTLRPTNTPEPSDTPVPTVTPYPTYTPYPTFTAVPLLQQLVNTPALTDTPEPTATPYPTYTPYPTFTSIPVLQPTVTPEPTDTPVPTVTPYPTYTPYPTFTSAPVLQPTYTALPTPTPYPTYTPYPTPAPTYTLYPTYTPYPTLTSPPPPPPPPVRVAPTDTPPPTPKPKPVYSVKLGRNVIYERWGRPAKADCCCGPYDDSSPVLRLTIELLVTNLSDEGTEDKWKPVFYNASGAKIATCIWYYNNTVVSPGETVDVTFVTHVELGDYVQTLALKLLGHTTTITLDPSGAEVKRKYK